MIVPTNAVSEAGSARPEQGRRPFLDITRGVAVLCMVVYHTAWDLSQLQLIETDIFASVGWRLFARAIAASFLFLSGVALVLAHRGSIRWTPFWRRFAVLAGAALAVTVVTRFAFPASYIFFGILHNMAISSLIAIGFVRLPAICAAAAALLLTMGALVQSTLFDAPLLAFLGLGTGVPDTNDWVPIIPWTGYVLAGVAVAQAASPWMAPNPEPRPLAPAWRWLTAVGRRSLAIYLLHQPLIFGALFLVRQVVGPNLAAEAAPFMSNCMASCQAAGRDDALCRRSCACTVESLRREGLWGALIGGKPDAEQMSRASDVARSCVEAGR